MSNFCLVPWVHSYISPNSERRMCCASREPAQSFMQYIDTNTNASQYSPVSLKQHWNNDHMKSVRVRMMNNETLPECEVCNNKLLNVSVYRDYFTGMFGNLKEDVLAKTNTDGTFNDLPISFDYRLKNTCTFKCRMCGPPLSSSWEAEERKYNTNFTYNNKWAKNPVRQQIRQFQEGQVANELWDAIKENRISEMYWAGGEPLDWPEHWKMMQHMVDNRIAKKVYVRYNTNLSKISFNHMHLISLLPKFKDWQICASLDATGATGEYIRTGLNYLQWLTNFKKIKAITTHSRQLRIDLTVTLPGLLEIEKIVKLANDENVEILTKNIFSFSPDIVLSPLSLPRSLLNKLVDEKIELLESTYSNKKIYQSVIDVLQNLKKLETFEEKYKDQASIGLQEGKARIIELEKRRNDCYTIADIFNNYLEIKEWWNDIQC